MLWKTKPLTAWITHSTLKITILSHHLSSFLVDSILMTLSNKPLKPMPRCNCYSSYTDCCLYHLTFQSPQVSKTNIFMKIKCIYILLSLYKNQFMNTFTWHLYLKPTKQKKTSFIWIKPTPNPLTSLYPYLSFWSHTIFICF